MQTGVEMEPVAGVQTEETAVEETQEVETGVEQEAEAQDPKDFAFAQRFSHEKQKLERQYEPIVQKMSKLEQFAQSLGFENVDEYLSAAETQKQEAEREQLLEQGIDPDYLDQVVSNNPVVKQAEMIMKQQQQKAIFDAEVQELFAENEGLTPEQVPPEVFQLKADKGITLLDAYLRVTHKTSLENAKRDGEQAAIGAIRNNASPGSLSSPAATLSNSIDAMSKEDFERYKQEQFYKT
jgi:hypothetical protein